MRAPSLMRASPVFRARGMGADGAPERPPVGGATLRPAAAMGPASRRSGIVRPRSPDERGRPQAHSAQRTAIEKRAPIKAQAAALPREKAIRSNSFAPVRMEGAPIPGPSFS